ncbi:rfaE bifunctional protein, domain II [Candidatus Kryptonium thompsonii]|uniref:D-glycero-beta-D-manno-heptose 1-phosphate adenylyltransferase n=1 Tax=Candidatus Kryptonium thompsonii TaxID=1633631 RepID=A0A0P1LNG2_9BACT|nr:D-glycero-beta-D-manno-heptose 1-phosphate adenylyltransferase [Candidatus Kryptonium thompsoni]CUS76415.1 rfaE bifunctional protein, domain II [Candidatus Kryptonium thompsoni]CUS76637.1 rfaE bifunctional protein, domain II [Candidatus Kryptonium thompsoni]CUS78651.1 rfaE bifunctional protein, domain II [Candidatus Kryptonium thompsoni]CUS83165.1 rfaE bifunctional protein, domain II [Candidatus Kryptonium thompsoni]CUS84539.1 rfaE bifunctional protein, domain II [Candidatus Kryptonium thom
MGKVVNINEIVQIVKELKSEGKKVVFTNGCFDILHRGHVEYLAKAKELGDVLIVGLNSDSSVKQIKGDGRPIVSQEDRAFILSNLAFVDYVVIFDEPTPYELISKIIPDVLVKGNDWAIEDVVGRDIVEANGGRVVLVELTPNRSTTNIIKTILERFCGR